MAQAKDALECDNKLHLAAVPSLDPIQWHQSLRGKTYLLNNQSLQLSFKDRDSGKIASSVISLILMIGCIIVIPVFFLIIRKIKTKKIKSLQDDF